MQTYSNGDLTFDVTDSGPEGGDLVVLLHGFPQDRRCWDLVRPRLNDAGLRTIAPDQRGYSPGAMPKGRSNYRMSQLVRDVVALIDAAGHERAHIVGHDWGGAVAWGVAGMRPDRVASVTVCSTPHPSAMVWAMRHGDQARRSRYMLGFQVPVIAERQVARSLPKLFSRTGLPEVFARQYADRFASPSSLTGPLNWYRAMASLSFLRNTSSPESAGATITVPTTYVWGARDFALGRDAAERTASYVGPDYRFVELDAGHWIPETHATEVADAVLGRAL
ncbi:alpha/beta fold hydrolase [Calidifontibacter sp. DB0510]|uniref:Alpha/beta fold hydrolase n=1 Tax=Metallococcus carri TaxID=1656884 RepID=A0A967B4B4_9MICO|nr:alpha/beta fold hydrolase [Metallococcus carri]NHN55377.1 alpha/beta fold hydrolase [Metallococcus carri]NOP36454.1 alpha/beta fold hydrolase [Calidifontibacter sp. DB2511S]